MKKLSLILIALLMSFVLIITGSPESHAVTTYNGVYTFDAMTDTKSGVSLTIAEGTNTFTANGTVTSTTSIFQLSSPHDTNTNGSVLSTAKYYVLVYEYVSGSGTFTGDNYIRVIYTPSQNSQVSGTSSFKITGTNYQKTAGNLLLPIDTSSFQVSFAVGTQLTNLVFKVHFIEVTNPLANEVDIFTSGVASAVFGGATISITTPNVITINGSASASASFVLDSYVESTLLGSDKLYLFVTEYISGTIEGTGYNLKPIRFNADDRLIMAQSQASSPTIRGYAQTDISTLSVENNPSATVFTNYSYRIRVQEIELYSESTTPGETTTPPDNTYISGSYYNEIIYFNEVTENPFTIYPAVYIATATGDTFDLAILVENMVFVSTSANIRFYIGRSAGGEENIGGVGDFVISKDETNIYITKLIDDVEQEEIYAPLSDFGFLMIETATPATVTWTVTYISQGSTYTTQEIDDLDTATIPTTPVRAGYDFVNWVLDPLDHFTVYDFGTPLTADLTLYAYWEPNGATVFEVTFITGGGTAVSTQTVEDGDLATEPTDPLRSGYTFVNWVITGTETVYNFSTPVTANVSLTAVWEESEVTFTLLTFNSNGGSFVQTQVLYEGDLPVAPSNPTRAGYTFSGWYKDIALTQAFSFVGDTVTSDTILYAKWTPNTGGGDPITEEPAASGSGLLYIGIGAAVLAVWAGLSTNKKKGRRR